MIGQHHDRAHRRVAPGPRPRPCPPTAARRCTDRAERRPAQPHADSIGVAASPSNVAVVSGVPGVVDEPVEPRPGPQPDPVRPADRGGAACVAGGRPGSGPTADAVVDRGRRARPPRTARYTRVPSQQPSDAHRRTRRQHDRAAPPDRRAVGRRGSSATRAGDGHHDRRRRSRERQPAGRLDAGRVLRVADQPVGQRQRRPGRPLPHGCAPERRTAHARPASRTEPAIPHGRLDGCGTGRPAHRGTNRTRAPGGSSAGDDAVVVPHAPRRCGRAGAIRPDSSSRVHGGELAGDRHRAGRHPGARRGAPGQVQPLGRGRRGTRSRA